MKYREFWFKIAFEISLTDVRSIYFYGKYVLNECMCMDSVSVLDVHAGEKVTVLTPL